MLSERLLALAKEINKNDIVLDVGCDHGYLSIYLKENKLCKTVFASDISENALNFAKKNFDKYKVDVKAYVSDGFENIPVYFNTAIIAGMGTSTILRIINNSKSPNKLVISSHNDQYKLRKSLNKLGYKIIGEKVIFENNHYYNILNCIKGHQKLAYKYLKFGISNNLDYYKYLFNKNNNLIKKVPLKKKLNLYLENIILKKIIEKI